MIIKIVGGGLAGCEAAYQLLKRGNKVALYEMRPLVKTLAHQTESLAELVCSNSFKSTLPSTPQGLLKEELRLLNSIILSSAEETSVQAGSSLAVNRESFSKTIENKLFSFPNFNLVRKEVATIDEYSIIATGPLTSFKMVQAIERELGEKNLYFYDAISPIISAHSIDYSQCFWGARYNKGTPDFLNCPMNEEEYFDFWQSLVSAERVNLKEFENKELFGACMPIEEMARKGINTLRFGPLRPVGLRDKENKKHYSIVQLRKENLEGDSLNLIGFQTNLKYSEQDRIFRKIPALRDVEFFRYGQMHKNTFINGPQTLSIHGNMKARDKVFFAGQITGVEGYLESTLSGLVSGINMNRLIRGEKLLIFPDNTLSGRLMKHISTHNTNFQPMNAHFGLLLREDHNRYQKKERRDIIKEEALLSLKHFIQSEM